MTDWPALRLIETKCQHLRASLASLASPTTGPDHRTRHRLEQELSALEQKLARQQRCRSVYNQLAPVTYHNNANKGHTNSGTRGARLQAKTSTKEQAQFMRDLTLPQPALVINTDNAFTDICKCGEQMQRHPTMSFTTCPKCFCKRIEIDMCARDISAFVDSRNETHRRVGGPRSVLKNASHYGTFLNSNRSRKTKSVNPERLRQLCKFCFVEGARTPSDITPKIVNRAQKHIGGAVEYPLTRTYVSLLRDDNVCIPDAVKPQLMRLFSFVQPIYSQHRIAEEDTSGDNRTNMPKFTFVTRILCRLLGYDILVPLFDNFSMSDIVVRRTSIMRRVFAQLGWVWCDKLADDDIDSAMLDAYDEMHAE